MPARSAFQDGDNSRVFDWSDAKTRLGYSPDHNFDANNGEFYVDGAAGHLFVTAEQDVLPLCIAAGGQDPFSRLSEFALFLDVRRAAGSIDRLWMKNGNENFLPNDTEQFEVYPEGGRYQVSDASPLFNLKKAHHG